MIVALALVLSSSNMYGYIRCKVGSNDIKSAVTSYVGKQILFNVSVSKQSLIFSLIISLIFSLIISLIVSLIVSLINYSSFPVHVISWFEQSGDRSNKTKATASFLTFFLLSNCLKNLGGRFISWKNLTKSMFNDQKIIFSINNESSLNTNSCLVYNEFNTCLVNEILQLMREELITD